MSLGLSVALLVAGVHVGLPSDLSDFEPKRAAAEVLIGEDARVLARSRWRIENRRAELALRELDALQTALFADRIAVLRGRAHEVLRDPARARAAYQLALEASSSPSTAEDALRGLVAVTGKLGDHAAQLRHLDELIGRPGAERDYSLELERINALAELGRKADARGQAWAILEDYPNPRTVDAARRALANVEGRSRLSRQEADRLELARARSLVRAGRLGAAVAGYRKLSSSPAIEIEIELAEVYRLRDQRVRAQAILERLLARRDAARLRREVLQRLAKIAVERHQFAKARALYIELETQYPGAGALEAAQLEHDEGRYQVAANVALEIADRNPSSPSAPRALWLAGWSAYLARTTTIAADALLRLHAHSAAEPQLKDAAEYWLARTYELRGARTASLEAYRDLATRTPLKYYGLLARERLQYLGEHAPIILADPARPVSSVEEAIAALGPDRPINIDRSIALFRAQMRADGVEELLAATEYFRRTDDRRGMAVAIDLFRIFDREAWVLLLSRNIAEENREISATDPHFSSIWRQAYPTPFLSEVERACSDHGVDVFLAYAVMRTESRYRPNAVSPVGARGLMQLMPATARWIGRTVPGARSQAARYRAVGPNIWLGAAYVRNLLDRFDGNLVQVLAAYNAGPGAVDRWKRRFGPLEMDELAERTPYTETRQYIRQTLESYLVYHAIYDREVAGDKPRGSDAL